MKYSNDVPDGYKATELGVLPEEWDIIAIGKFASSKSGGTPSTLKEEYWKNGTVPWVNSGALKDNFVNQPSTLITKLGLENSSAKLFPKKTVLIALTGATTGRVGILDIESSTNQSVVGILPNSKFISEFLFYTLMYSREQVLKLCTGAAQPHINKAIVENFLVPFPPLPEQHAISTTLRTLQEAKEKTEDVIAATKALKAAMMKHLFRYGPLPTELAERVAIRETEIGQVPEGWDLQPLGNISKISSGGTPSRTEPSYWNGEIPWIRTGEINYSIIEKTEEKITKAGLDNSSTRIVPKGTLLMAMYGEGVTRGRVGITGIDASINQAVAAIFPSEKLLTPFLYYYLEFSYEKNRLLGHGAHQRNLSATIIKTILVPVPTEKTQQQIVEILSSIDQKLAAEQSRKEALDTLFTSLLDDLMTAKIRVKPAEIA
ncbi:MAG: restriction endonuclease subunit S [Methanoregula sp.]|nr:restriction endonuclease subunit S [Methanoregula sp.]